MGSTDIDVAVASAIDSKGNLYTVGTFSGTVDFDNGLGVSNLTSTSQYGYDMFILKLDSVGNFIWVKRIGGTGLTWPKSLCFDSQNNIYFTGYFNDDVDFDPSTSVQTHSAPFSSHCFILKLTASGDFLWCKDIGTTGSTCIGNVIKLRNDSILMIGGDFGTSNGGPINFSPYNPWPFWNTMTSGGSYNPFVLKLDTAGNFIWVKGLLDNANPNGNAAGSITSCEIATSGDIYLTGFFRNSNATSYIDFDPGPPTYSLTTNSLGNYNTFVTKLNSNGQFVWAHSFPCPQQNIATCLHLDSNGNVFISGRFQDTVDFDPGPSTTTIASMGGYDSYFCKFDASGNYIWAKTFGGLGNDVCNSFQINNSGNIYCTGGFGNICDFDPGPGTTSLSCAGVGDAYVSAFSSNGNFLWVKQIESLTSNAYSETGSLEVDQWNNIYVCGYYYGTIDLNTEAGQNIVTSVPNYNADIIILKLGRCEVPLELTPSFTICTGQCATLTANGATTYSWVSGPNASQYTVCPASTTIYSVSGNISQTCIRSNSVMVTVDLCTTGLTENSEELSVSIFPNPVKNKLRLNFNSKEIQAINVYNILGQKVFDTGSPTEEIDFTDFPKGLYLLTLQTNNRKKVYKIIKE